MHRLREMRSDLSAAMRCTGNTLSHRTGALPALRKLLRAVSRTGRHEKNLRCSMNGKEKQRLRRGRKAETMLRARTRTEKDVFSKTERLKQALETADAVLIGAGAGLSASAGFTYSGERFHRYFSDFEAKYGFHGSASAAGNAFRSVRSNALHREHPITSHRSTACIAEIASSSVPYRPSRKKFEVQYEWQRKTAAPARKEGRDNA